MSCPEYRRRGLTPFPECTKLVRHFKSAYNNYKWRDYGARYNPLDPESSDEGNRPDRDREGGDGSNSPNKAPP